MIKRNFLKNIKTFKEKLLWKKVLELKSLLSQVDHKELLGELTSSLVKEASSGNDIRNIIGNIEIGSV